MKNRELLEWCTVHRSCFHCEQNDECDFFVERNFVTPDVAVKVIENKIVFDENWLNSTAPRSTMTNRDLIAHCISINKKCFGCYSCEDCEAFRFHNYELDPHKVAMLIISGRDFNDEKWLESEV